MILKNFTVICLVGTSLALSGCLIPEKFEAKLTVSPDASTRFQYEGTVVHGLLAGGLKDKKKAISAQDEAKVVAEAKKSVGKDGITKLNYLKEARFALSIDQQLPPLKVNQALTMLVILKEKNGSYAVIGPDAKVKDLDDLKKMGLNIDGTVEVILPANAKVLSHNANSTPGVFSKAYRWKVGLVAERPSIRFTL